MPSADTTLDVAVRLRVGSSPPFLLDVEFTVPPGITVLFGPSGCGKSTALAAIAGVMRPDAGRIRLGRETWLDTASGCHVPAEARHASLVFQSLALFPHMTALGNVMYGIDRGLPISARRARAWETLTHTGVAHLADRRPATFSGGESQRVALARAFARAPRLLLLDEPLTALDTPLRARLAQLVRAYVDQHAIPAIYVTHDVGEAMTIADRAVVLAGGRVTAAGAPLDVLPFPVVD
jgi:molybdate transport system ATP-binding protein